MKDLVIVGAGGFAGETVAAVQALNEVTPTWRLLGFLDDDPALRGQCPYPDVPVLDGVDAAREMRTASVVVCVGNPRDYAARMRIVRRLGLPPERYATVVHPSAQVSAGCSVGPGSVLLAQVVLTAQVRIGAHVAVMPQVVLTHQDVVDEYVTIASGVRLGGGVRLARGAYVGAGALVREGLRIGSWSLVGMGSVVLHDIPPGEVWAGSPARYLRPATSSDELQESINR
ncbi:MAG: acetyltransferase [Dactylosporangium sp.]|jgi:sugar O-acyltransferase (sialic acid O-acetyltransferase NeuD family)|nr:acetyltransferase [Dactylosporangium sp.]